MGTVSSDAVKLSYKSNTGRAQQLLGFKTQHLENPQHLKNSKRRLRENSIATSTASLLPVLLVFIFTSVTYYLLIFFLHLIIGSIHYRCYSERHLYDKQHNTTI